MPLPFRRTSIDSELEASEPCIEAALDEWEADGSHGGATVADREGLASEMCREKGNVW